MYRLKDAGGRDLCLRYELTFKLAKIIALNRGLSLPIKRYEVGKVFRDGPVKAGRSREFTQCDVDEIGTDSLIADAEFSALTKRVFSELNLPIIIRLNNKKLLFGLLEKAGILEREFVSAALSIDKLEKIGRTGVISEMVSKGFTRSSCGRLFGLIETANAEKDNTKKLALIEAKIGENEGTKELRDFLRFAKIFGTYEMIEFSPTLSRGLAYYTGNIWEIYGRGGTVTSSLAAGGRWDGMINKMSGDKGSYPAVGMTFGLDAIYDALNARSFRKFIKRKDSCPVLMVVPIDTEEDCVSFVSMARDYGIRCDIALGMSVRRAFELADKRAIPFMGVIGSREAAIKTVTVKDISSGASETLSWKDAIYKIRRVRWR